MAGCCGEGWNGGQPGGLGRSEMRKLLCWLMGHDRMVKNSRERVCVRCGLKEKLRMFGSVIAWEEQ
jgi:hypothetical protein